jgi:hypothetical protein
LLGTSGNQSIALTWTTPSNNGGASITSYSIQYKLSSDSTFTTINTLTTTTNYTITSLINGLTYNIQIAAINSNGTSSYTSAINSIPSTISNAPTNLLGTSGNQSIALTWTTPSNDGGSSITAYSIQYKLSSDSTFTTINTLTTSTNYTITSLTNGLTYNIQIATINSNGTGPYTSFISIITGLPDPILIFPLFNPGPALFVSKS